MQVQIVRASTRHRALAEAKRLLGPDPLILSVRRRHGNGEAGGWEAIVARETPHGLVSDSPPQENQAIEENSATVSWADLSGLRDELAELREHLGSGKSANSRVISLAHRLNHLEGALVASALQGQKISEKWTPLVQRLEGAGYPRVEAIRLVRRLEIKGGDSTSTEDLHVDDRIRSVLCDGIEVAPAEERLDPGLVVFAGGAGVGKTTLAAKLAADLALGGAASPVLGVLKPRKGVSLETIRRCATALGIEFVEVHDEDSMTAVAQKATSTPVILDSPAVNPLDGETIDEFRHLLSVAPDAELHTVVSTCYGDGEFARAVDAYAWAPKRRISATHLDEAPYVGRVMSAAARTSVPIGYFSLGPRIPDDLSRPALDSLVESVLRSEGDRV